MDAFTLVARLTLNRDEFNQGLKQVETDINSDENKSIFSSWGVTVGNLASDAIKKALLEAWRFAKSVFTTGMDFESMMSSVKAVAQPTEKQFQALNERAQELGASTKFTATEVGEAFYYMGLAGWKTEEMLAGIDGVLNLAAASGEDLGTVSDIVTDALTAMGLTANDASHFVDVLAAASTNSNTTVAQMGDAFKYLATTGGVMKYSIEDVASVLGLLANNGIKAGQAGTSMRQILNTLINPSDQAAEAMEKLGLSLFDYSEAGDKIGGRKPLMQVVQELREIFKEADFDLEGKPLAEVQAKIDQLNEEWDAQYAGLKKNNASKREIEDAYNKYLEDFKEIVNFNESFLSKLGDIGGLRGISSLFALMNATDDDVNQLVEAVNNSSEGNGAAYNMSQILLDNLQGDVTILNSAIDGLKIALFEDVNPLAREFVQTLTEGVTKVSNFIKHGQLEWTAEDEKNEAIGNAEADAAEAQGIVSYMDTLIEKYGQAATNSGEWADAMARLQELFPDINGAIKAEGDNLKETTESMRQHIEMSKQKAIEDAKRTYLADLQKQYNDNQVALGKLEVGQDYAIQTQLQDARRMAEIYLSNRQSAEAMFGQGYRATTDEFAAYNTVEEIVSALQSGKVGLDSFMAYLEASQDELDLPTLQALRKQYEESQTTYDSNEQQIKALTDEAINLQTQLSVAEAAIARLAEAAESSAAALAATPDIPADPGEHAAGNWFVPYNDYPALLHRGEAVLTASQARQFRENASGANLDISALTSAIVGAVQEGLRDAQVNAYLDGYRLTREIGRRLNDQVMLER
jgi:DNA-binding ferritin-like protein (Dps family)